MEFGEIPEHSPETVWLPGHTRSVPDTLQQGLVIGIAFPKTPEECRAAWAYIPVSTGSTSPAWVGRFTATYSDGDTTWQSHVSFLAPGTSENPNTETTLAFTDAEWEAFAGGVRLGEFDRPCEPKRPGQTFLRTIALLVLTASGPMLHSIGRASRPR